MIEHLIVGVGAVVVLAFVYLLFQILAGLYAVRKVSNMMDDMDEPEDPFGNDFFDEPEDPFGNDFFDR